MGQGPSGCDPEAEPSLMDADREPKKGENLEVLPPLRARCKIKGAVKWFEK
jgi:hypothetical protein